MKFTVKRIQRHLERHKVNYCRMLFYLIVGSFINVLLVIAGTPMNPFWFLVPVIAVGIVTTSGEILLRLFHLQSLTSWLPSAFVIGSTITSVVMIFPTILWQWPAQTSFLVWGGWVIVAAVALRRRWIDASSITFFDPGVVFLFTLFVAFFCRFQVRALSVLQKTDILPAWVDYYSHGTLVASFGDPLAVGVGDIMLPGFPRAFYHWAPYMLSAALSQITGLSGLGLATAIMLPLGLLICLLGLFGLAAELSGIGPALVAVWLVASLPDASHYLVSNNFYGFHWTLYTSPGSGYAIGLAAISYSCALSWFRNRRIGPLLLTALLTLMLILARVHMFMLMAPALVAAVGIELVGKPWRGRLIIMGCFSVFILTCLLAAGFFGRYGSEAANPFGFFQWVLRLGSDFCLNLFNHLAETKGQYFATLIGGLLIIPATLGLWSVIFPLVALWESWKNRFQNEDYFFIFLIIVYLLLIFWAPKARNGDFTEYKHRHFVLLYALVLMWTILRLIRISKIDQWLAGWRPIRSSILACAVLIATVTVYRHVDAAQPEKKIMEGKLYAAKIGPGIVQSAEFMRAHAGPGDMFAVNDKLAYDKLTGPALQLVSMSDLPLYVGRIELQKTAGSPEILKVVKTRAAEIVGVDTNPDRIAAFDILRSHGIRWYVCVAPELPAWDKTGNTSIFHSGSTYVYDAGRQ